MIVRGIAEWASVFEPNNLSGKYQVDICQLDKTAIKDLKSVGIDVKKGEGDKAGKGAYITAKSSKYAPKVWDRKKNEMHGHELIGNGSEIKASIKPYEWSFKGKSGISPGLNSLMVLSLVPYDNDDELEVEDDDEVPFDTGEDDDDLEQYVESLSNGRQGQLQVVVDVRARGGAADKL